MGLGSVQNINRKAKILEILEASGGVVDAALAKSQMIELELKKAEETNTAFHTMDRKTYQRLITALDQQDKLKQYRTTIPMHSGAPKQVSVCILPGALLIW